MLRILWLDRLRILATFTVVWLHVSAGSVMYSKGMNWWVGNIADTFAQWAVPIFVMITGSLLLGKPLKEAPDVFYRRRLGRILLPLTAWTCLYLVWGAYRQQHFDIIETIRLILIGNPYYHMAYLYMLVGLYLVAPFFNYAISNIPRSWLGTAVIVFFIMSGAALFSSLVVRGSGGMFLGAYTTHLGYFLAGHYFATAGHPPVKPRTALLLFFASGLSIALITGLLMPAYELSVLPYMYGGSNPLVIIMSFSIFWLLQSTRTDEKSGAMLLKKLTPLALGIYLIHPIWIEIILEFYPYHVIQLPILGIPAVAILAFILSIVTCHFMLSVRVLKRIFL